MHKRQKKYQLCYLKNINNIKSKNILKIEKNKKKIKYIKKMFEILLNTIIDFLLFSFLLFNILSTFINNFVANRIILICKSTSLNS